MAITDALYIVSILVGLFIIHFGFPMLLMWLLKVLVCWACQDTQTV
jgi:hypothetical protein